MDPRKVEAVLFRFPVDDTIGDMGLMKELEKKKAEFEAFIEKRKTLGTHAEASGSGKISCNYDIDPSDFFPTFSKGSTLYKKLLKTCVPWNWRDSTPQWPNSSWIDETAVPEDALKEIAFVKQYSFFESIRIFSRNMRTILLLGMRDEQCSLIAFWGDKVVYEEIERKLEKFKPKEGEAAKKNEAWPILVVAGIIGFLAFVCLYAHYKEDVPAKACRQAREGISTQPAGCCKFGEMPVFELSSISPSGNFTLKWKAIVQMGHVHFMVTPSDGVWYSVTRESFDSLVGIREVYNENDAKTPPSRPTPKPSEDF